ncbi:MAG: hypothetical protein DMF80_05960 [Acidobacteria bacterium]|nr:MAG: hypothetical protein DMF80_05960 [Acidobacteriota bacterium]
MDACFVRIGRVLLLVARLLPAGVASASAGVDPAVFQELRWRLIGPFRGGRALAVSGVPGEPNHFYFGSVNGGVWETSDAGRTWTPIFDGQPIGSIGALAVAPSNPRVIYVGSGEADMRSDIAQGDGAYRTSDGGQTWTKIGLADTQQIARILVDPRNPERVFVAALGHPYGPNAERGVFRSTDGGSTWQRVLFKDENTGAIDLAFKPGDPAIVYASLWQTRRPPWSVYPPSNGPGSGLYKSSDGGTTWTALSGNGFPARPGRIGLAVAPTRPDRLYAMVDAPEGGLYRSEDGGASWTRTSGDRRIWGRGWYFGGIAVEPRDPEVVYACNTALYRSRDGGKTFVPVKGAPGGDDYHELWIDPEHPERRILGTDQGVVVSLNGGESWSSWHNQPTGQMYHVITDNRFPYWVYGAQQDSGSAGVPSRTTTIDGITMMQFREMTAGYESDMIAPDPKDPDVIYGGRVDRLDLRTQQTQSIDPTLAHRDVDRAAWTLPLAFSRRDPRVLYFSRERLFRTEDGGRHWTVISPDLSREDPGVPATLDPATAADAPRPGRRHGVIYAIAPSRLADRDLWLGTDDGRIWRTRDEGVRWEDVTPAALTPWSKVGIIEPSHFDAETAYAAVDRHRLDDFKPYVYRTHDGGKSWTLAAEGIAADSFVNAVREDPVRKGLLYAGTEKGVYVSFDDGDHWQNLQLNLPVSSVRDLDVHGDDLVAATHGRAFWILDDVTPLRQAKVGQPAGAMLFAPAVAVRLRPAGFTGTPIPRDEPMASNPPPGAVVDYVLKSAASTPVVLSVLDGRGGLVRRYGSAEKPPSPDLGRIRVAPEWVRPPGALSTAPGMHRFVWPLRYPAPAALAVQPEGDVVPDGVWAPPGCYTVELSVDGQRLAQPLTVAPDPRVSLPAAAYERQFALARRIEEQRARVSSAIAEAERAHRALLEQARAELDAQVLALTGPQFGEIPGRMPPAGLRSLRVLAGSLSALASAVDGADAEPTPEAEAGFSQLPSALDATLAAWSALKASVDTATRSGAR